MIQTICGVLILITPFILIFNFQDKIKGFLHIFTYILSLQILIALTTQIFHIFSYEIVLSINILVAIFCILIFFYKKKYFSNFKFNWLILFALVIVSFELLSIHYFYSGIVSEANSYNVVSFDNYPYPQYSDEWAGVSFVDYSISNKSLPLANPLWYDQPFANPLVVFYSFISEIFLLLNLNPLITWSFLAVMNGLLISFLIYILLRINSVSNFSSIIATISIPLILNGTNVPGIWFLTPFIFGFSVLLISLILFSKKESFFGIFTSLISLLIYPPLIVFVLPILIAYKFRLAIYSLIPIGLIGLLIIGLLSINSSFIKVFHLVISWMIRSNLDGGGIVSMSIWIIVPVLLFPLIILGLISIYKSKKYLLLVPIVIGLLFWILYIFFSSTIIIDQSRIVVITSILLMIPVGFGIELFLNYLNKYTKSNSKIISFIKIGFLLAFAITAIFYPGATNWSKLILKIKDGDKITYYAPSSPITRYLHPDDLKLFSKFSEKRFITLPWKGLVLGVATHNYPLDSKASTLTNSFLKYSDFMDGDCNQKVKYVGKYSIDYVYSRSFKCDSFEKIGSSQEGLYLYRII